MNKNITIIILLGGKSKRMGGGIKSLLKINGVKIMGSKTILNNLALSASNLYAKNLSNFVNNLYNKDKNDIFLNKEDEIISKTLIDKEF